MSPGSFSLIIFLGLYICTRAHAATLEETRAKKAAIDKQCLETVPVDGALLYELKEGRFPDDPSLKCFLACWGKAVNAIKDGKIDVTVAKNIANDLHDHQERAIALIEKCAPLASGPDDCEVAYQYVKCAHDTDPELYLEFINY